MCSLPIAVGTATSCSTSWIPLYWKYHALVIVSRQMRAIHITRYVSSLPDNAGNAVILKNPEIFIYWTEQVSRFYIYFLQTSQCLYYPDEGFNCILALRSARSLPHARWKSLLFYNLLQELLYVLTTCNRWQVEEMSHAFIMLSSIPRRRMGLHADRHRIRSLDNIAIVIPENFPWRNAVTESIQLS